MTASVLPAAEASSVVIATPVGTPIPLDQLLNPTPGLGFDFTHLAAVNSGLAVRAFIDPITQHELALAEQLPETQPAVFFPLYSEEVPVLVSTPQPPVIVVQQPVPQSSVTAPAPTETTTQAQPAPLLPVGELLLVKRDGGVIKAVAFTVEDDQIIYITERGQRRSIALDQVNLVATEQRNAEHGTILHLVQ